MEKTAYETFELARQLDIYKRLLKVERKITVNLVEMERARSAGKLLSSFIDKYQRLLKQQKKLEKELTHGTSEDRPRGVRKTDATAELGKEARTLGMDE